MPRVLFHLQPADMGPALILQAYGGKSRYRMLPTSTKMVDVGRFISNRHLRPP